MKEYIVITPSNLKKKVIELSRKKYYNYNIKFMSINEFIDKYTFIYDNKTIYNILNKYTCIENNKYFAVSLNYVFSYQIYYIDLCTYDITFEYIFVHAFTRVKLNELHNS